MRGTLFRYGEQQLKFRAASVLKRERALQPGYRKETETEQLQTPDNSNGSVFVLSVCLCLSVCLSVCVPVYSISSFCLPVLLCLRCCCLFVGEYCADGGLLFCMSFYWFETRLNSRKTSFLFLFKCLFRETAVQKRRWIVRSGVVVFFFLWKQQLGLVN